MGRTTVTLAIALLAWSPQSAQTPEQRLEETRLKPDNIFIVAPGPVKPERANELAAAQVPVRPDTTNDGTAQSVGIDPTTALFLIERMQSIVDQAMKDESATEVKAVGTSGAAGAKITIERALLDEMRADLSQLRALLKK
jgi:hypothetical protein